MLDQQQMKKLDMGVLICIPVLSTVISLLTHANYLTSILLFFGLPAIWMSYRTQHRILRTALFALVTGIPFTIIIDHIAVINRSWYVPTTVFPFRLLGTIPMEDMIWSILLIYSTLIVYEHFLHKGKQHLVDHHMKYLIWPLFCVLLLFFIIVFRKPELFRIPYAYLWLGSVFLLIPTLFFVAEFPAFLSKYVKVGSYFFFLSMSFEMTALQLGQWTFPSTEFVGWVELFHIRFPFEEFFFWFCIMSIAIMSYYEFFDDDPNYERAK